METLGLENAIWDDGEWVSWDEIDRQIRCQEWRAKFPKADLSLAQTFESLLSLAESHYVQTGRHLQVYGEIGELFAAITLGLTLNRPHAQGSDGRLGKNLVEVRRSRPRRPHVLSVSGSTGTARNSSSSASIPTSRSPAGWSTVRRCRSRGASGSTSAGTRSPSPNGSPPCQG